MVAKTPMKPGVKPVTYGITRQDFLAFLAPRCVEHNKGNILILDVPVNNLLKIKNFNVGTRPNALFLFYYFHSLLLTIIHLSRRPLLGLP